MKHRYLGIIEMRGNQPRARVGDSFPGRGNSMCKVQVEEGVRRAQKPALTPTAAVLSLGSLKLAHEGCCVQRRWRRDVAKVGHLFRHQCHITNELECTLKNGEDG